MANHNFPFEGGGDLRSMGATWFVSYAYYNCIDKTHTNWNRVTNARLRIGKYETTKDMHHEWLRRVDRMSAGNLSKNTLGIMPAQTKAMAKQLLAKDA